MPARVVFNTFGSLGDLHPHIAIALEMQSRGCNVALATSEFYRQKVEAVGLEFIPIRPDLPDPKADGVMARVMDARQGPKTVVTELLMPAQRQTYEDLLQAVAGADLLVSHVLPYAARLVAEKTGVRWASLGLAPLCFFSSHDPPVLPQLPALDHLRFFGRGLFGPLFWLGKAMTAPWCRDWHRFRRELGLSPFRGNVLIDSVHSPHLVVGIFSPLLAEMQPDWPASTRMVGFPFYDHHAGVETLPVELEQFLEEGDPPIVFTLGSAAVMDAGSFYERSVQAAEILGRRAVLLIGIDTGNRPQQLPQDVIACDYAPYSALFPRAAAIVHQGGMGTTGQGMRSGRPTLIMPYSHDQFDNAARVRRLGISRTVFRKQYTAERAARELQTLLGDPAYASRAAEVGRKVQSERGVETACDELEAFLARQAGPGSSPHD